MRGAAIAAGLAAALVPMGAGAVTELHLQYGKLVNVPAQGGGSTRTTIFTLHHANQWRYGDVFLFADQSYPQGRGDDFYTEIFSGLGAGKLSGRDWSLGPLRDFGPRVGVNYSPDRKLRRWLAGWRLAWDVPGFRSLNTDFYGFFDDSAGLARGGIPKQSDSWQVDVNFVRPIMIGGQRFSVEGHVEYTGRRRSEVGLGLPPTVLGQPQFRYDLGNGLLHRPDKLFVGVEWQFGVNKRGSRVDENRVQALLAWRF